MTIRKTHPVTRAANLIQFLLLTAVPFGLLLGLLGWMAVLALGGKP